MDVRAPKKKRTSALKSLFSCGPGGGKKLFDPRHPGVSAWMSAGKSGPNQNWICVVVCSSPRPDEWSWGCWMHYIRRSGTSIKHYLTGGGPWPRQHSRVTTEWRYGEPLHPVRCQRSPSFPYPPAFEKNPWFKFYCKEKSRQRLVDVDWQKEMSILKLLEHGDASLMRLQPPKPTVSWRRCYTPFPLFDRP